MDRQLTQLRELSMQPAFVNNPNTPIAKALRSMMRRKPTKSAARRSIKNPSRLSIEKSKRNMRLKQTKKAKRKIHTK